MFIGQQSLFEYFRSLPAYYFCNTAIDA